MADTNQPARLSVIYGHWTTLAIIKDYCRRIGHQPIGFGVPRPGQVYVPAVRDLENVDIPLYVGPTDLWDQANPRMRRLILAPISK